ncbi:DUF2637 domain-containing protein [Streptomyces sp. NPDC086080]|uniref:DUF2637 domain-containing protein n=1 Tax=Streptomyces sp. NPDC086080 TaxID=3365748 RepID=UPI0037D19A19
MYVSEGNGAPLLTRGHRILIGVVVTGAVVIAGIGFAGSYAAVHELAVKKGFGDFAYVFPIGIDAGICVLLALDLLLTWIRIPFPALRQTAWLLTAATIAFNGAAAWPDPLGVGMHAVIPVLFVVAVEAARHAVGRIADITADRHMEGVRLTRWLLSPIPTFLLWRRMKLWELRSYEQAVKREQERLVYQAGLRSRFGRSWRRKAPVESLMPLRLARYGLPLAAPAPARPVTAGTDGPPVRFTVERPPVPAQRRSPGRVTAADRGTAPGRRDSPPPPPRQQAPPARPGPPGTDEVARKFLAEFRQRSFSPNERPAEDHDTDESDGGAPVGADLPPGKDTVPEEPVTLTTVDRYYLSWTEYRTEQDERPRSSTREAEQLSSHLARKGMHGRGGRPVSPSTLRRYLLAFRVYNVWAEQRTHGTGMPSPDAVARECAARGITAQHKRPLTPAYIAEQADDFERRWQALGGLPAQQADPVSHMAAQSGKAQVRP